MNVLTNSLIKLTQTSRPESAKCLEFVCWFVCLFVGVFACLLVGWFVCLFNIFI